MEALLADGRGSLSPLKRKRREQRVGTAAPSALGAAASAGRPQAVAPTVAGPAAGGRAAADGLLRVKKVRQKYGAEEQELRSILAPLAAAGAAAPSGAAGLLVASTPHLHSRLQEQQRQHQDRPHAVFQQGQQLQQNQQQSGEVKLLEDLFVRRRLPVLRSCLLPSPSPSLQSLVLQRLAGEAGAFPAAFSPFRLLSHTAALPATAAAEDGGSSANAAAGGEGGENDEGRAVVAFLCFLKEALEAAPAAAVSFDAAGRLRGRRTAVLLKHVEPAAAAAAARQAKSHQSGSSGDCSANSNAGGSSNSDVRASTCGSNGKSKSAKTKSRSSGSTEGVHGGERRAERREERKGKEEGAGAEDCRKFLFEAPVEVHVVGSFPLNLTTCFWKNVDVCVMMPPHMFGPRDHINYRYFNKRNAYIQLLYEHLRDFFAAVFSPSSSAAAAPRGCPRAAGVSASGGPAAPSAAAGLAAAPTPRADSPSGGAPGANAAGASGSSAFAAAVTASAAFSRCAASAAAFKAAAPHVVPRVFLQAWQGCVEKPVIAVRFVVVREKQEGEGEPRRQQQKLRRISSSRPEQLVSPVEQQEAWTLQQQLLLQQWVVRVLAVPCPAPGPETEDKEQQRHVSNSTHHSSGDKETGGSSSKKASSGSGGDKRKPFAEHMLAVDRNCVREPTTCCRDLSFAMPAATTAPAEGSVGSAAADSGTEDSAATQKPQQHQETEELPPTPYYNMLLLEDLRLRQHQRLLYRCCRLYGDGFREAVLLLKVWALRRGFIAADNACGSAPVRAAPAADPSPPPPLLPARAASGAAEEEAFWWKEASDVSGFLLAMLCCHACLAAADTLAAPVLAQQLLSLTLSFLAEADFLRFIYILGDPQPYRRQEDLKTLRAALVLSSSGGAEAATEEAVAAGQGVAGGLQRGRKTVPLHGAPGTAAQAGATAEGGERVDAAGLSVGLMDEAYLFDSPSCCFNLLWRAQLHVAELQQEARSSLQALQRPADAYHFVFAPPSSAMPSDLAGSPGGDSSNLSSSGRSSEHAQLHLLLQGDVQLYIPRVPQQPDLYFPAAAYPVGNYLPFTLRPQLLRGKAAVAAAEAAAASTPTGSSSSELAGLDALPKWETPQPVLLAASLLRLLVRGLGDRLRCYRVRVRRWCRPPAAPAAAAGSAAGLPAEDDAQDDTAMAGQPLAWTAKTAEAFLRGGPPAATGLVVSLELNGATAARLVEKGPSAAVAATAGGTPAAAAEAVESFRLFWGPARVEVRRFHDAQTLFAVVWDRPSDEDQQLRTLLLQSPASGAGASAAAAAVSGAAAPLPRRSPAGRAAAAGGGGAAAAHPADQQRRQLLPNPPPHTQVIRHLLQRHLPHLLVLLSAEDPQPQQQEPQHQHGQSSVSKWHGTQTAPAGKRRSGSTTKGSSAIPGAAASDAALCILASTPLGAVPGLSNRHKQLVQTFNELRNTICSLSSLPLAVKQIWHAGTALRFADATPLSASDTSATTGAEDAMDRGIHRVVVEFEDSSAWPEEAAAVRHVKVAFLLAMRKELLSDHGICAVVSPCCCLDVELGLFTFRVVIFHPAEAAAAAALYAELRWEPLYSYLRQRATHTEFVASRDNRSSPTSSSSSGGASEGGSSSTRGGRRSKKKRGSGGQQTAEGDEAAEAASAQQQQLCTLFNNIDAEDEDAVLASPFATPLFARKHLAAAEQEEEEQRLSCLRYMWWEPQVAAVLHACALRYPPFAGCVRLAKRWVAEKQLPACMHLVEHIVTVVFVAACDWGYAAPPQSVHVAFIRFLHLVAGFEWEAEPFIVCFDPDAPLGVQREQLMRLSFEKFHRYPSVQSLFDPHGFIIPLPDAVAFARFLRSARSALASIVQVPFCPSLASTVWKDVFSFSEWSSMDFVLFLRKDLSVTDTKRTKKRYANDFRPTALPACVASVSFGGGEAAAVAQLLLRAATSSQHHVGEMGNTSQPGARMLFSPSYVRRFLFLRFLRELLCSVWTGDEATFCASDLTLLGMRSALSLAYNPLKGALQGGGMPVAIGVKLNIPRAHSGGFSLFLARSLQPSVTFPRCCFSVKNDAEADEARQADVDQATEAKGKGKSAADLTEEGSGSKMVDCLNPVLLMAGLFAAGGELVESIQICGC